MIGYIYHIVNTKNNKRYIGKTIQIEHRLKDHFARLQKGKHHSHKLQRAFNKYGEENFSIEYRQVEVENEEQLSLLEIQEIEKFNSYLEGYNETLGGEGCLKAISFEDMRLVYHITKKYTGVHRKIANYFKCDHTVIDNIAKNSIFTKIEPPKDSEINKLISLIGISEDYLNENYEQHNIKKLTGTDVLEILSVITAETGYDKTLCEIFNVSSKCLWRLKNNLIYQKDIKCFTNLKEEEKQKLKKDTFTKYNLESKRASRQRAGVKNALTQDQIDYILDHKGKISGAQIARDLQISADRVSAIINEKSYKDLIQNYKLRHNS